MIYASKEIQELQRQMEGSTNSAIHLCRGLRPPPHPDREHVPHGGGDDHVGPNI